MSFVLDLSNLMCLNSICKDAIQGSCASSSTSWKEHMTHKAAMFRYWWWSSSHNKSEIQIICTFDRLNVQLTKFLIVIILFSSWRDYSRLRDPCVLRHYSKITQCCHIKACREFFYLFAATNPSHLHVLREWYRDCRLLAIWIPRVLSISGMTRNVLFSKPFELPFPQQKLRCPFIEEYYVARWIGSQSYKKTILPDEETQEQESENSIEIKYCLIRVDFKVQIIVDEKRKSGWSLSS